MIKHNIKRLQKNNRNNYKFTKKVIKSRRLYKSKTRQKTKKHKHKYYFGGFTMDEATNIENRDKFRKMFISNFTNLKKAIDSNDKTKIEESLNNFRSGFRNQKMGINNRILATTNTFQPIDKTAYSLQETVNIALFPSLVILYESIQDTKIRKKITELFIKNGGNINLESTQGNVTVLSDAIKLRDKSLIQLLIKNGASIETLNEEQKLQMNSILTTHIPELSTIEQIEEVTEPPLIIETNIPSTKLVIPTELPPQTGYPLNIEPEFWVPLFGANNMFTIREKLQKMMENDRGIPMDRNKISDIWNVCKIIQNLIPTYFVPVENKPYQEHGLTFYDLNTDFSQYNILLCASLLVFGIISQRMKYQDYQLCFKGGKAIQLVISKIPAIPIYESEDIDVLLMSNTDIIYNEVNIKNLSGHVAYLIQWFLTKVNPIISVLVPNPANPRANPFIFKLSYIKGGTGFKPISDIDFKDIPETIKPYFERSVNYQFNILELEQVVLFKCPDIGSLLDEKLYYYTKYTTFKDLLTKKHPISEPGYKTLTITECDRLLSKFKKAIINLNNALQISRTPQLSYIQLNSKQLDSTQIKNIVNRLNKLNVTDPNIKKIIIQGLQYDDSEKYYI